METMKYPRTSHLPFSEGISADDRVIETMDKLYAGEVVVTEKLDGENFTLYNDTLHARSMNNRYHVSRDWLKAWWARRVQGLIPNNIRLCGEYLYAKHSIRYNAKELVGDWFRLFSIWEDDKCLSWDDTVIYAKLLDIQTVPTLYRGAYKEDVIKACYTGKSYLQGEQEGYVVRITDSFACDDFSVCVAKFVRANHVQTDKHWSKIYNEKPNGVIDET